jgi:hypothetical protein
MLDIIHCLLCAYIHTYTPTQHFGTLLYFHFHATDCYYADRFFDFMSVMSDEGPRGSVVLEALCYKPEGSRFETV